MHLDKFNVLAYHYYNMRFTVSITSQGQISIPAKLRRSLNLSTSGKAVVSASNGKIVVEPVKDLLLLRGSLKTKKKISSQKIREDFVKYLAKRSA